MTDTISRKRRSENMRRIKSRGMRPEMAVRRMVHGMGYRFRLHRPDLPGKPDIVLPRHRKVIDVRGCFWHQHRGCIDSHTPKTNVPYWKSKLRRNVKRDRENNRKLRKLGFKVLVVWECETALGAQKRLATRLLRFLRGTST